MNNSITEDFKTWENYPNGSCELFGEHGKPLAKFDGEIRPINGYLYVYQSNKCYNIIINDGQFDLYEHVGAFPVIIRKTAE